MKIISITGVTKTAELPVTKSIGAIIFNTNLAPSDLLNEKISIYIERGNGNNVILANKVLLKDFILASTYGTEAIQSDANFGTIALCELAKDGSIFLADKESIKITLEDLRAVNTYELYGIEEPIQTDSLYFFEQKSIASEEINKRIDVKNFDLAILNVDATISDLSYQYENGIVVKYLPFELQTLSCDVDPVSYISNAGVVSQRLVSRLALPLHHVDYIEINKSQGSFINFVVRTLKAS